jgi:hypothetical protein
MYKSGIGSVVALADQHARSNIVTGLSGQDFRLSRSLPVTVLNRFSESLATRVMDGKISAVVIGRLNKEKKEQE